MTPRAPTALGDAREVDVVQGLPDEDLEAAAAAPGPASAAGEAPARHTASAPRPPTSDVPADVPHALWPALEGSSRFNHTAANLSETCFDPETDAAQRATVVQLVSSVEQRLRDNSVRSPGVRVRSSRRMDALVVWNVKLVKEPKEVADEARRVADAAGIYNRGPASVSVRCDGSIRAMSVSARGSDADSSTGTIVTAELAARTIAQALLAIHEYQQPSIRHLLVNRLLLVADTDNDSAADADTGTAVGRSRGGDERSGAAPAAAREERDTLVRRARQDVDKSRALAALRAEAASADPDERAGDSDGSSSDLSEDSYEAVTAADHSEVATDRILDIYSALLDALLAAQLPLPHAVPHAYGTLQLMWNETLLLKEGITWFGGLRNVCQLSRSGTLVMWDGTEIDCTEDSGMAVAALDLAIWGARTGTASYLPSAVVEAVRSVRASRRRVSVGNHVRRADVVGKRL